MCKRRLGVSFLRGCTSGVSHANSGGLVLALIFNHLSGILYYCQKEILTGVFDPTKSIWSLQFKAEYGSSEVRSEKCSFS